MPQEPKCDYIKTFEAIDDAINGLAETVAALTGRQQGDAVHHRLVRAYVGELRHIQDLTFSAASATGYCYICHSYPHRPTATKKLCSRCGNRP